MAAPAGNPAWSPAEQSRAQKSDRRHRAADGGGPVALANRQGQSPRAALAQNARQLTDRPVLSGWLHHTTQNLAANAVRSDVRRRAREQEAAAMNELHEPDAVWEHIAPHLDQALGELSEADRDALLLRYFQGKSAREMAQTLGTS